MSRLPGVEQAALAGWVSLGFQKSETTLVIQGAESRPGKENTSSFSNVITPGYFDALGVKVRQGRAISDQDDTASLPVVMVNETLAHRA